MNSGILRLLLLISICSLYSCKELYYPEIEDVPAIIAVEGLITDQPGHYTIKLTYTSGYYNHHPDLPVDDAIVTVSDNNGEVYQFIQIQRGLYISPIHMEGEVGNTYTLEFETSDGYLYRSRPQTILSPYEIEEAVADSSHRTRSRESYSGRLIVTEIEGVDVRLAVKETMENPANIRFQSDIKLLYTSEDGLNVYFCWKEMQKLQGPDNINLPSTSNRPGIVNNNVVAFLPYKNEEYGLDPSHTLSTLLLKVRLFSINEDSYTYYLNINKQLTPDEGIFAPVPSQIESNIYCVNDENRAAAGLFEASAVTSREYIYRRPPRAPYPLLRETDKYYTIPSPGCAVNNVPSFWIY